MRLAIHPLRLIVLLMLLTGAAAAQEAPTATPPAPVWSNTYYAPYVYMGAYPSYLLAATTEATGIHYYTLGFVLGGSSKCKAAWMGSVPIDQPFNMGFLNKDLTKLRALGGDVIISFGGAGGTELAQICTDPASLKAEYQAVMDIYGVTSLDFDIEGDDIHDTESMMRRSQVLAELQAEALERGQTLTISFTLPVQPTGLTEDGVAVLQTAIDAGVDIEVVNIMTMNFGDTFPTDQMGANTIQAAESLFIQLKPLYPDKTEDELWNMIGLTPMLGINDRSEQIFQLSDAELVTTFAVEQGIQRLANWSLDRDQPCEGVQTLSYKCSGVEQEPYAFSAIFNQITR